MVIRNKLSRRAFLTQAMVAGTGVVLAACAVPIAPTTAGSASSGAAAVEEPTTVRFMSNSGADAVSAFEDLLANDFRGQHPTIEVFVEPTPDGWQEKLVAQMAANAAPDIFEAWGNIIYQWTGRDLVLDLQPYVDRDLTDEEIADFTAFQWEGLEILGVRAGMPRYINLMTESVNVDLFEQYGVDLPPADGNWTWEDYTNMARSLTEAARTAGEENQWGGYMRPWSFDRFWFWVEMFGGKVVNEKYGTQCLLDSDEAQAALQWMYDMYWTENVFARPDQIERMWFADAMSAELIMSAEESTYPVRLDTVFDGKFRWDMRHLPVGPTGERAVLGTTDCWSLWGGTQAADAAWETVNYMTGSAFQLEGIVTAAGQIPVRQSLQADFIERARSLRPELENVRMETIPEIFEWGYAKDTFWFKDQLAAAELIRPALEAVYISGTETPDIFIELAQQITEQQESL